MCVIFPEIPSEKEVLFGATANKLAVPAQLKFQSLSHELSTRKTHKSGHQAINCGHWEDWTKQTNCIFNYKTQGVKQYHTKNDKLLAHMFQNNFLKYHYAE